VNCPAPAKFPFADVSAVPLTVKKLSLTPDNVYPVTGVTVIVAVYVVLIRNFEGEPLHEIAVVYCPLLAIVVCGVAPATGAVTVTLAIEIIVGSAAWACELIAAPAKIRARVVPVKESAYFKRLATLKVCT